MNWFRSNIKHGARLALLALALQFGLSFGHFHADAAQAATIQANATPSDVGSAAATADPTDQSARQPGSNHESDGHAGDPCAICAVIALAGTVLFATPPVLPLPQAIELPTLTTDAEFAHLNSAYPAFRSRAPPVS